MNMSEYMSHDHAMTVSDMNMSEYMSQTCYEHERVHEQYMSQTML